MNAVTYITARTVRKPAYNNAALANFGNWYRTNEPSLQQYWRALGGEGPEARRDFFDFCCTQYDVERIANPAPVYARLDRCAAPERSFEQAMEDATGKPATGAL